MLECGREPLPVGRRRRRATKAQPRALLRREGGCARPGCPETRLERLHAHHLRHWLFGGRTDLANLVLLCDADHGLVHDLDLVMARRDGTLIVTSPGGRRVRGTADVAFTSGLAGLAGLATGAGGVTAGTATAAARAAAQDRFVGVHPIDTTTGRRPAEAPPQPTRPADDQLGQADQLYQAEPADQANQARPPEQVAPADDRAGAEAAARPPARRPGGPGPGGPAQRLGPRRPRGRSPSADRRSGRASANAPGDPRRSSRPSARSEPLCSQAASPPLPDAMPVNGERMNLGWAIGVLMGNREALRRRAAEAGTTLT